jgi:hypothetical protein
LEVGARRVILGWLRREYVDAGEVATMAVSAIPAGGYEGRVREYFSISGHNTFGLRAAVSLNAVNLGSTPEPTVTDSVDVRFSNDQDGLVGEYTDSGDHKTFSVQLPWDWFDTFWHAISSGNCSLAILWNADKEIIDFDAIVAEGFEGAAEDRRERIDAMRREGIDAWRRELGAATDSY